MALIYKYNRGVTLIELMVVVAIMGVLFSLGPNLIKQIQRYFFLNNAKVELQRDARLAMGILTKGIRQAQSSTLIISQRTNQPYYSSIRFTDIDGRNVHYYQEGDTLFMNVDASTRTLSENLRYLAFSLPRSDDMGIISLAMTMEKGTYEGQTKALHMASERVRIMN